MATKTETSLTNLVINYLSESDYNSAVSAGTINENELYMTPTQATTDTKNTAGSTNTSNKIYLIGATSQAANPQTYSHDTAYVGTDGCLYSNSTKVSVNGHTHSYLPLSGGVLDEKLTLGSASNDSTFGAHTKSALPRIEILDVGRWDESISGMSLNCTHKIQLNAGNGIECNNQKVSFIADPTGEQDAVNLRTLQTQLNNTVIGVKGASESSYRTGNVNITVANLGLTASTTELNYCKGVTSAIQTQLNNTVKLSGNQTVAGTKTFNDILKVNGKVSNTTETSNSSGEIQIGSNLILRDYGNYSYIIGGTDGTGLKIGNGLFVDNTAVSLEGHKHSDLYHSNYTAGSILTIGNDSDGYWFRPTDVSATGNVNLGSSANPFNLVSANILRTYDTNTTSNGVYARIHNNRIFRYSSSSRRYKENIKPIEAEEIAPEKLYDAEVVQFTYKDGYLIDEDSRNNKLISGFIVEDLEKVYPIAIDYNDDGEPEMWNVNIVVPSMLKLIQDQKKKIDELETRIEVLEV